MAGAVATVPALNARDEFSGATRSIDRHRRFSFAEEPTAEQCNKWHHAIRTGPEDNALSGARRVRSCAGMASRLHVAPRTTTIPGNPREGRRGAAAQAQRKAAGARAARPQPFNPPPERPRCSREAGPPRTRRPVPKFHLPELPAISRTRDSFRYGTDGQARCPPPQSSQITSKSRPGSVARATLGRLGPEGRRSGIQRRSRRTDG